ncbi:M23 family metallopeptidase [Streptacidiphilus jiangxiensis]|uniref:Murein DD-endopeptidase MepM and murein hydrolase activator NlpD, contain LysM domain n=1 Tax=Streptacidiphilus jiangxiensis TaxID=235985 RepID=A0A1H7MA23_STRJI|nr:M23 family metallopeptidase [Streptacidiphilus jiangxiensis]SEL08180.1 Murein DD-endopeptidase MepM and murein hydrolase activator NlpD, contain LysM domain [Streptacidiphilus jiangxiensis]
MTADTSWYGQQTLVHPDYSHQPYTAAYGDPYVDHQQYQYGYAEQPQYGYHDAYAQQYATAYATPVPASAPQGHGWPEYYAQQPEPTLVAEYGGYPDQAYAYHQDYSAYDTVTDVSFAEAAGHGSWASSGAAPLSAYAAAEPASVLDPLADGDADTGADAGARADADSDDGQDDGWTARSSRRRPARRRSAVLTIAVPSVVVLGVAGAAAATVGPLRTHHTATTASADPAAQTKAQALAAQEARDAAERAARDQARTALQLRNAAARKTAAEAPRYTLPIAYHTGLSALFGQAGTHWMQLHTGIDFPVPEGTPVHAVTGGTVTTEWNPFYGYMVKLTAPDGTVTWYCHLSSYRVRSGHVKVGDIIAYSGDTGNSTGPHLHFEVHPDGGPAVDPLPWLLARGLDPR